MAAAGGEASGRGGRIRLALGLAVSAGALALLLWNVKWAEFWASIQGADYGWLGLSILALLVAVWLKVVKWQLLLRPTGEASRERLLYGISVGFLVNTVLPGRLGELARVYLVARLERLSLGVVLSSVAVDRILDVVALALLLAAVLPATDLPVWVGQSGLLVGGGGVALLALCLMLAYPRGRGLLLRCLGALPVFPGKPRMEGFAESLCVGVQGLKGAGAQLRIVAATAGIWFASLFIFYFGQLAFHIEAPLAAAALVLAVTNLGMVVPSSPGYVGVFHYLAVLTLGAFGVEREVALGFAVVIHLAETLPLAALGALSLWRCGLTLSSWREAS